MTAIQKELIKKLQEENKKIKEAIHAKCNDCMNGHKFCCQMTDCELWEFRMPMKCDNCKACMGGGK